MTASQPRWATKERSPCCELHVISELEIRALGAGTLGRRGQFINSPSSRIQFWCV